MGKANKRHGKAGSTEWDAWRMMRYRCENSGHPYYHHYGGRGIRVCKRWRESFAYFYADMGPKPTPKHSLDRIDNDGPYSPENCRWATATMQHRNTRTNKLLTYRGETLCVAAWAERLGIKKGTLYSRLHQGWSVEKALTTPVV